MPTTSSFVRWFSEITLTDVGVVGGKNASLGEMFRELHDAGVRVPDGFATTAVNAGVVTLTGSVRLPAEQTDAEETVRRVYGVRGVVNEILVPNVPGTGFEAPDDDGR